MTDLIIEQARAYFDALVKSRFIEMFGTSTRNEKQWPTEKMKEVAPAIQSDNLPKSEGNWLLNLDAIQSNSGQILFKNRVSEAELNGSIMTFSSDHILYSKLRPYLNKVVVPDESGFGTTELIPLLPNKAKLTRTYLAYLLRSDAFVSKFSSAVAGTKMPRVSMDVFWKFDVPLPPMNLQKEFGSFVNQIDKSKVIFEKEVARYDDLIKSRFIEMFGPYFDDDKCSSLGSLCDTFVDGDWIESKDQDESGIRLIQTGNIGIGTYLNKVERARFINEDTFVRLNCTEVFPGDVLISRLPDPLARSCIVPEGLGKTITGVDCTIIRFGKKN